MIRPFRILIMALLVALCFAPSAGLAAIVDAEAAKAAAANAASEAKAAAANAATSTGEGVKTLKRAIEAQGEISPQTARAIEAASAPPGAQFNKGAEKGKGANVQKNSGKAIYGDIIIHR